MTFGSQNPLHMDPAQVAAAQARLQRRMEHDPRVPSMQPGGQYTAPAPAFVNGPGGARISPDEMAFRRRQNANQMAMGMDTSPVGHWTQGLARVANALVANRDRRELDRTAASDQDARTAIVRALIAKTPDPTAITSAMIDPDPAIRGLGERVWSMQNPKPQAPSDLQQRVEYLNSFEGGLGASYARNYAANGGGAPQFITTPQGTFMVPRTPPAGAQVPSTATVPEAAISYLRSNPGTASQFDQKYGSGASERYLQGGAAPTAPSPFATR